MNEVPGIAGDIATKLVATGNKARGLKDHGLDEVTSTRALVYAANLIDLGPRLLVGLVEESATDLQIALGGRRHLVAIPRNVDVVGIFAFPQLENDLDAILEHLLPILIQRAERLGVAAKRACADAEDEAPLGEMIDLSLRVLSRGGP